MIQVDINSILVAILFKYANQCIWWSYIAEKLNKEEAEANVYLNSYAKMIS